MHHAITPKMDFVVGTEEANVLDQYKCNFILKMSSLIGSGLVYSGFICLLERIVQLRLNWLDLLQCHMALFAQKLYWNVRWCELMALWLAQLTYMISHSQDITQPDLKICLNEMLRLYLVGNWNLILCGGNLGENFNPWELQWPEKHGTTFAIVAIYLFFKPNFGFHKSCLYPPRLGLEFHFLGKKGVHCYLPRSVLAPNTSFPKTNFQNFALTSITSFTNTDHGGNVCSCVRNEPISAGDYPI